MIESGHDYSFLVLLASAIVVLVIFIKIGLKKIGIPALVGYILLGLGIRWLNLHAELFSNRSMEILQFFAKIGIITLLFRIGLESNLQGLVRQLRRASVIWIFGVIGCLI